MCTAGPAGDVGKLVTPAHQRGRGVQIIATPSAIHFIDTQALEAQTNRPVRSQHLDEIRTLNRIGMTTVAVVEQYWSGVLDRLQAEVDVLNRLVKHWGEQGTQNELSLARVLERLTPRRYGVGSGLLIDAEDNYSQQTDIIIWDRADEPAIFAQTNQVLFPVENVHACLEVKTTLGKQEIEDAGDKRASILGLHSLRNGTRANIKPFFGLVAYHASQQPATLARHLRELDDAKRPDLVCIINAGFLAGRKDVLEYLSSAQTGKTSSYVASIVPLHQIDSTGSRIAGAYAEPSDDMTDAWLIRDGRPYPLVQLARQWYAVEPSRSLLLFCESLLRILAERQGRPTPTMTHYLQGAVREVIPI